MDRKVSERVLRLIEEDGNTIRKLQDSILQLSEESGFNKNLIELMYKDMLDRREKEIDEIKKLLKG